jgi:hypothetical protein
VAQNRNGQREKNAIWTKLSDPPKRQNPAAWLPPVTKVTELYIPTYRARARAAIGHTHLKKPVYGVK